MKLSFCAIAKNEEAALPSCLSSIKNVVDEIVVLDTGSTDRTVEIAKEFGARVYHFEWCNDFSIARNESLKYVQGDWVLVLDADEVLLADIVPQIKQVIEGDDRYLVINLVRQEVGAVQSPYSMVSRLFRNRPDICFSRPYHAMVDDSVQALIQREPQWQVGYVPDVAILHYGYQQEAIASRDKLTKAKAAMEGFLANHPNDAYVCGKLGALYVEIGDVKGGIKLLERGLKLPEVDTSVLYELHYHLGNTYTRLANFARAAAHYQEAIQQPILPKLKIGAYNNLGNLLLSAGYSASAKTAYETTLRIDPNFATGYYNLGMTLKGMELLTDAIAAYQQAIKLNPKYAEAYQNLGVVLLKIGDVPRSLESFRVAIALHEPVNPSEAKRLRQGLEEMGFQI